jgi:O-antigen/teichoic acid export membrane protein
LRQFLSRSEYGIWGILVVVLVSLLWLKQVGIGDKYVQQREGDQELAFQKAFTLELAFNALFMVVLVGALPLAALVYGQPDLIAPGLVLCVAVVAVAFQTPTWVYYRSMRFGRQRAIQAVDPVVSFAVTVALAVAGLGYWALVIGVVVGACAGGGGRADGRPPATEGSRWFAGGPGPAPGSPRVRRRSPEASSYVLGWGNLWASPRGPT